VDFNLSPEEEAFRQEVRDFLDEHLPPRNERTKDYVQKVWLPLVRERRWVGFSWPREIGGGGGSVMQQAILKEEMTRARAPALGTSWMGLQWVGPGLIAYGTPEQQQRFLPGILDSEVVWCTGYSEPHCGSDLAALKCKAIRDGDDYVVNGQKIWTSFAMTSDWIILLVRTSTDLENRHAGITCLLVPMKAKGVTVRPIKIMSGISIFAEVFFDDVRVPAANRVGGENQGWTLITNQLNHERVTLCSTGVIERAYSDILGWARETELPGGGRVIEQEWVQMSLARVFAGLDVLRLMNWQSAWEATQGTLDIGHCSAIKVYGTEFYLEAFRLLLEILGPIGYLKAGTPEAVLASRLEALYRGMLILTFGGGTNEMQRDLITMFSLGFPRAAR